MTVVMLHSGGMSGRQWRKLAEALSDRYRVVRPDFLGSGANPAWPAEQPFHFHQDVAEIEKLLESLHQPYHLIGHSYGGLVALTVARAQPEKVASLSLYDPVAFGILFDQNDAEGLEDLRRVAANPIFTDDTQGGGEAWMHNFIDYWNGPGSWQAMPEANRQAFLQVGRKVYYEVKSLSADRTPLAAYTGLTMPALLVYGEKTPPAARRVQQLLATALPQADLKVLTGAGHMGPLTHGPAFQQLVADHLARSV
ncbi:MAG: alpha/beta hydrolase [Candidatus Eremiobacteraeota bacterium]|nr:alpha/beta hydrolase [Candidatus Eremiobacteraeota bacterium]